MPYEVDKCDFQRAQPSKWHSSWFRTVWEFMMWIAVNPLENHVWFIYMWNHLSQLYVRTEWEVGETSLDLYTDGTGSWNSKEGPVTRQTWPPTGSKLRDHKHWHLLCLMIFMSSTPPLLLSALIITTHLSPFIPVWTSPSFPCCWTAPWPETGLCLIHPYLFTHCAIQASTHTLQRKERSRSTTVLLLWLPLLQSLQLFFPHLHLHPLQHSHQPQLQAQPQLQHRAWLPPQPQPLVLAS